MSYVRAAISGDVTRRCGRLGRSHSRTRQLAKHGTSIEGMPPLEVKRGSDGELVIYDGVTRATRVAKYLPGTPITVEVTGQLKGPVSALPTVGEKL